MRGPSDTPRRAAPRDPPATTSTPGARTRRRARLRGVVFALSLATVLALELRGAVLAPDTASIEAVRAGRLEVANAAWWGFDPEDATEALQAAIRSKARKIIVPMMPSAWVVRPIHLRGGLELEFEPGVLVLAKAGEFKGGGDCLFRADDQTNIVVRGYGATLRMRKRDYQNPPYPKAEWRMGLAFNGCENVTVAGLRIESSGGDGIYIASSKKRRWSQNVTIRDCICADNHRQGISVISAVNLLIENCVFSGTDGTPPEAGIDLEPDEPDERLTQCVIRNCLLEDNSGNGILVYLKPLTARSADVSIRFEDCHVRMGPAGAPPSAVAESLPRGSSGIAVGKVGDDGPKGLIEFLRCTTDNTAREAVRLFDTSASGVRVRFDQCRWRNAWLSPARGYGGPRAPILVRSQDARFCARPGGIDFVGCSVFDTIDGATVRFEDDTGACTLTDVSGVISVLNPKGVRAHLGPRTANVSLELRPLAGPATGD